MIGLKELVDLMSMKEIVVGMKTTISHLLKRGNEITELYPHQKRVLPDTYRGILSLLRYNDGSERCVGCCLCEAYCPSNCITVDSEEDPATPGKRWAKNYVIDIRRCVFCGYCVEACPVNALAMTPNYEAGTGDKEKLCFDKDMLLKNGECFSDKTRPYLDAHNMGELSDVVQEYPYPRW